MGIRWRALIAGLACFVVGGVVGITGFMAHAAKLGDVDSDIWLRAAGWTSGDPARGSLPGLSALGLFTFLLLTPRGWVTLYLIMTGTVRAIAATFDESFSDPLFAGVRGAWRYAQRRTRERHALAERLALEGEETPDRVVTGTQAGIRDAQLVVIASRRKVDWTPGTVVETAEGFFRIGDPTERTIAGRLRTLYPLTSHPGTEVVRRHVHYDLPTAPR